MWQMPSSTWRPATDVRLALIDPSPAVHHLTIPRQHDLGFVAATQVASCLHSRELVRTVRTKTKSILWPFDTRPDNPGPNFNLTFLSSFRPIHPSVLSGIFSSEVYPPHRRPRNETLAWAPL